jgi:hypothetical protein
VSKEPYIVGEISFLQLIAGPLIYGIMMSVWVLISGVVVILSVRLNHYIKLNHVRHHDERMGAHQRCCGHIVGEAKPLH